MKRILPCPLPSAPSPSMRCRFCKTLCCLLLIALPGWTQVSAAEIIDRVVAVVNNDVITLSDLQKEGEAVFSRIQNEAGPEERTPLLQKARQELLSLMIDRKLIEQRAAEMGVAVTAEEEEAALERIVARNKATREDFRRELQARGMTEEQYRRQLKEQILQSKLIAYEIRSRIVVTDEQVRDYYDHHFATAAAPDGYHLLQIGVNWDEDGSPSKEEARQRAEQVRQMAREEQNFKELAANFSDLPSAADGGDLGVFRKDEMAAAMREVILPLKPGEVSPVIESQTGYQFFKLLSVKNGEVVAQAPLETVKDEIKNQIYQKAAAERYEEWLQKLRQEAYIKELL